MAITDRQKELDLVKWEKSQLLGVDACGTFDYCRFCNKEQENPCDLAFVSMNTPVVTEIVEEAKASVKKRTTKKTTNAKSTTKKTIATKKSTTTKKPATTKKTTKK